MNLFALLFSSALLIALSTAQDCKSTGYSEKPQKCPKNYAEVYRQKDTYSGDNGMYMSKCCQPGTQGDKNEQLYAKACSTTACVPLDQQDTSLCPSQLRLLRYFNGKQMEYEETARDSCLLSTGEVGILALCCEKNSLDTLQATMYGVEPKEFPHFVKLGPHGCGGTIYNQRFILTASHCVMSKETYKPDKEDMAPFVRFNIQIDDAYTTNNYTVKNLIIHPDSTLWNPPNGTIFNDIALLELDSDIVFGENVKALPLEPAGFDAAKYSDKAVIIGYGKTNTARLSKVIQKANVLIRDNSVLLKAPQLSYMEPWSDQLLFVGGIQWPNSVSPSAAEGDSGGPAICRDANGYAVLCGVTSFAGEVETCADGLDYHYCVPSGYLKPDYFRKWIVDNAGDQSKAVLLNQPLFGIPVPRNKYLHQVHITNDDDNKSCGGTLIAADTVITAAHCVMSSPTATKNGVVVTATQDLSGAGGKSAKMTGVAPMAGFEKGNRRKKRVVSIVYDVIKGGKPNPPKVEDEPYYKNDVVVIKLEKPIGTKFAKLASSADVAKGMATEVAFPRNTTRGGKVMQRQFKLLDKKDCQKRYDRMAPAGLNRQVDDNVVCGVEWYSGGSMCDRELGGGLMCKDANGQEVLCGIQVHRLCEYNAPNLFVNVGDWSVSSYIPNAIKNLNA